MRTLGCAICDFMLPKCSLLATQRPGSTQKTDRSMGSDLGRHQAVGANHAVLLAAGNDLAGQQQQRAIGVVDQHQAVDLGARLLMHRRARTHQPLQRALLGDDDRPGLHAFVEGEEARGVVIGAADDGKDGQVATRDRRQNVQRSRDRVCRRCLTIALEIRKLSVARIL